MTQTAGIVSIDGHLTPPDEAKISVFDRGFLYGDSVYETVRVYRGAPFALEIHLERLRRSGSRIGFALPWSDPELSRQIAQALTAAALGDAYLRIIATRGQGTLGIDPGLAADPRLLIFVLPLPAIPQRVYDEGRSAALVSVQRNHKRAMDPDTKTGNYMNSVLAQGEATRLQAEEAIMLDHQGRVAEASTANVFAWVDDRWCTPPLEVGLLDGITRRTILNLCQRHDVPAEERVLWPDDLRSAPEIFVCSSMREVVPIVRLDGAPVGLGTVGERVPRIHQLYREEVRKRTGP